MLIVLSFLLILLSVISVCFYFQKRQYLELLKHNKDLEFQLQTLKDKIDQKDYTIKQKEIEYAKIEAELKTLKDNIKNTDEIKNEMNIMFQNLSNTTLEKQNEIGKQKIDEILKPFKKDIDECKNAINKVNGETRAEIRTKIDEMLKQTLEIGGKADRLANAFEGDKKGQGNFGELQFEELLKWYGFKEGENYYKQYLVKTEEQKKNYPDFILQAQPNKWLVVDSKFSISSYTKYINEQNAELKQQYLVEYIKNLKDRITELGGKEYHKLLRGNGKETFDFVCLFFGNEMAYLTAISNIKYRQEIEDLSRKYNVAIITASAFSPILQMIQQIWTIGKVNENIKNAQILIEKWLTKIADFNENIGKVGNQIDIAKKTYNDAIAQLSGKGSAISLAQNVIELVDAKLKPKNGKDRKLMPDILLQND